MSDINIGTTGQSLDNTDLISDFGKRSREFGKYLEGLEHSRHRESVSVEDRQKMQDWLVEARDHTVDPDAFNVELVEEGRPLDYVMLANIYRQLSDLVKDLD